jgi:hypothetical protein
LDVRVSFDVFFASVRGSIGAIRRSIAPHKTNECVGGLQQEIKGKTIADEIVNSFSRVRMTSGQGEKVAVSKA